MGLDFVRGLLVVNCALFGTQTSFESAGGTCLPGCWRGVFVVLFKEGANQTRIFQTRSIHNTNEDVSGKDNDSEIVNREMTPRRRQQDFKFEGLRMGQKVAVGDLASFFQLRSGGRCEPENPSSLASGQSPARMQPGSGPVKSGDEDSKVWVNDRAPKSRHWFLGMHGHYARLE